MSYTLYANDDNIAYGVKKFIVDTTADLAQLPTNITPGSCALVIKTSTLYILSNEHNWEELTMTSGESGASTFLGWEILL